MKNNTVDISVKLKKKIKIIISVKFKKIKNNNKKKHLCKVKMSCLSFSIISPTPKVFNN